MTCSCGLSSPVWNSFASSVSLWSKHLPPTLPSQWWDCTPLCLVSIPRWGGLCLGYFFGSHPVYPPPLSHPPSYSQIGIFILALALILDWFSGCSCANYTSLLSSHLHKGSDNSCLSLPSKRGILEGNKCSWYMQIYFWKKDSGKIR